MNHQDPGDDQADAEQEQEDNKTRDWKSSWRQDSYKRLKNIGGKKLAEYADIINGDSNSKTGLDPQVIFYKNRLNQLPEYNLVHFLKISGQSHRRQDGLHLSSYILDDYFKADGYQNLELRQLADAASTRRPNDAGLWARLARIHADRDPRVPLHESELMVAELRRLLVPVERYPLTAAASEPLFGPPDQRFENELGLVVADVGTHLP